MSKTAEFYFDFGSPASYLAWTQLPQLARDTGAHIEQKPMLLGGVFQATGNSPPISVPLKGKYVFTDFGRFAKRYGVPLNMNPAFPINTITSMRIACALKMRSDPRFDAYCAAIYQAFWVDGLNVGDAQVLASVLTQAGLDAAELLALAADPQVKEQLKLDTQAAADRGIFGAPTFFVGEHMFFGQDRMDFVREALG